MLSIPHKRHCYADIVSTGLSTDSQWEEMHRRVSGAGGPRSADANNVLARKEAKKVSHADS